MLGKIIYDIRIKLYIKLVRSNPNIHAKYEEYKRMNAQYHEKHKLHSWCRLLGMWTTEFRNRKFNNSKSVVNDSECGQILPELPVVESEYSKAERVGIEAICSRLSVYDIISFDMFDTLILRNVEKPADIFTIMAHEVGFNDYNKIRKRAEQKARAEKLSHEGTREIVLEDVYDILKREYNVSTKWMYREIELEEEFCVANPYMKAVYDKLVSQGKTIYIITDMYLPRNVIERILRDNGYDSYSELFLSNELKLRKGDGTLQRHVAEKYVCGRKIIHIGDNYEADIKQSEKFGFDTMFYPSVRSYAEKYREDNLDNLAGSFYRAVVNNNLHNGLWNQSVYFEHGFKVGGALVYGYCDFIDKKAADKKSDLLLFCARDCDVIHNVYARYYNKVTNKYIAISRLAILNVTSERYLYDYVDRFVVRIANNSNGKMTYGDVLRKAELDYIIPYMDDMILSEYEMPRKETIEVFKDFIMSQQIRIVEHNKEQQLAAIKYFRDIIGDKKNILIVDIGWSGSCISILKYFIEMHFSDVTVNGVLMCANDTEMLKSSMQSQYIASYVMSPTDNCDLANKQAARSNYNNMLLEYLFTSEVDSLKAYNKDNNGNVSFEYVDSKRGNIEQVSQMHAGILYFADIFNKLYGKYKDYIDINAYVAAAAYFNLLSLEKYNYQIFKDYPYDANPLTDRSKLFSQIYPYEDNKESSEIDVDIEVDIGEISNGKGNILMICHELTYTGAPYSLLRVCKIIKTLGYYVEVWALEQGEFGKEFLNIGVPVRLVTVVDVAKSEYVNKIKTFDMAILNTIFTDGYARVIGKYIPAVWFIREATNIPKCCENSKERLYTLMNYNNLYCVSEYAADFIRQYNKNVKVINNCVEDYSSKKMDRDDSTVVRFIQLGTVEYRKGYDVLLDAFEAMPEEYQSRAELYFAGQCRQANIYIDFWKNILSRAKNNSRIKYMGEIKDINEKIATLSKMDVVVVASRDESCSLVALEGAMMSKVLVLTENVGAQYMVEHDNGYIVETGDVDALADVMMKLIDSRDKLKSMGEKSRQMYEQYASIEKHTRDIQEMIEQNIAGGKKLVKSQMVLGMQKNCIKRYEEILRERCKRYKRTNQVIVSLTSHPPRIGEIHKCIESLLEQYFVPDKLILWLAEEQFPRREKDLPYKLLKMRDRGLEIRWCDDIKSHKKYYYTMLEYLDAVVITVDDDAIYEKDTTMKLYESYQKYPKAVSCLRAHRMVFDENGNIRPYREWIYEDKSLYDRMSYQALPTGVGGVLYPPHCLKEEAFDKNKIKQLCLNADDIWLKVMSVANGYPVVLASSENKEPELIEKMQESALYRVNCFEEANDVAIKNVIDEFGDLFMKQLIK